LGYEYNKSSTIDKQALGGRISPSCNAENLSPTLERTLTNIAASSKNRADEVLAFYRDFNLCLAEIARVVKPGGYICIVVGNRTVKGIRIPTDEIFIEMSSKHAMEYIETKYRNIPNKRMPSRNSPSNIVGKTCATILKESIIIFNKFK